ncbi:hypothetical protein D3C86_1592080 [compost metagenome]
MTVIATDTQRLSNVVKRELWPEAGYCRLQVTAGETADYKVGTVLGKITATGKFIKAVQTAVDGSAVAAAVVMEDKSVVDGTGVLALVRGPAAISRDALVLDASYNLDAEKDAVYAAFEALGIMTLVTV